MSKKFSCTRESKYSKDLKEHLNTNNIVLQRKFLNVNTEYQQSPGLKWNEDL